MEGNGARKEIERLKRYAEICSDLEIPFLHHTVILSIKKEQLISSYEELMSIAVESALEFNDFVASMGVQTIVENQGLVVNGMKGYSEFMAKTGGKIGMLLDVGNIAFLDESAIELLDCTERDVCHVHLKDYRLTDIPTSKCYATLGGRYLTDCEIGGGDLPWKEIFSMLRQKGYSGYYSLEFSKGLSDEGVERSIRFVLEQLEMVKGGPMAAFFEMEC